MRSRLPALLAAATLAAVAAAPRGPARAAELPYFESFDGPDGAPWPAPWFPGSVHVTVWDLAGGRARLNGDTQQVARMILPGFNETDVEALVTVEFEDVALQGFGFYARQNGGTLREYFPHGQGYALFLKGGWFWHQDLGLWREIDGVETQFAWGPDPVPGGLRNDTRYRLRYRVTQSAPGATLLRAKVWEEDAAEPPGWTLEWTDTQPELQGTPGSFAFDIYNASGVAHIYLDDLLIVRYPPAAGVPASAGPGRPALSAPRPHPIAGRAELDLYLPRAAHGRLSVYDAAGRLVGRPFEGWLEAGTRTLAWDPAQDALRRSAPGVFFLEWTAEGRRATRPIVILR